MNLIEQHYDAFWDDARARVSDYCLVDYPAVHPDPTTHQVVRRCMTRARQLEPELPDVWIRYVHEPGMVRGQAIRSPTGPATMVLNLAEISDPGALAVVVFHEARHVLDYARGDYQDRVALERRARAFAWRALEGWGG